ncbi:MAG: pyridoxal-dependent decarboxylase [Pseudomonadota bacterium]
MNHDDLNHWSKRAADWARDYHAGLRDRPVRPDVTPGEIAAMLPHEAPEAPEPMERIFADFERIVPEGMTHWQHPRFFAYFPANAAPASMLAEQLANAIAAQGMLWQTAPAATEIEEVMVRWLGGALGLPARFSGTIHDSATVATLSAVLAMREAALDWAGNADGLSGQPQLKLYAGDQTHSSIDKAARIAGIGDAGLVKVETDTTLSMRPEALATAIAEDRAAGHLPIGVILSVGGTSVGGTDRIADCVAVAKEAGLPTHVDAAWAGSAMICPEFRHFWEGVEGADSIVFNPHKWLGAQFDCAVQFLADPGDQIRTLGLKPAFLTTPEADAPTDFNDWTVPLGRRFRALKLWFVMRAYGLEGLRTRIRNHVAWAEELAGEIAAMPGLEIVTEPMLSLFTFAAQSDDETLRLIADINAEGHVYLTQTVHAGRAAIRVQVGQFDCTRDDVMAVAEVLRRHRAGKACREAG